MFVCSVFVIFWFSFLWHNGAMRYAITIHSSQPTRNSPTPLIPPLRGDPRIKRQLKKEEANPLVYPTAPALQSMQALLEYQRRCQLHFSLPSFVREIEH
jgi:hypothetical protein